MSITTRTITYTTSDGITLKSHFACPADAPHELSGILVAPEWWGLSEHAKKSAERLAEAGYAALAMDLYGDAQLTDEASVASANMTALLEAPEKLNERTRLALETLQAQSEVNALNIGAIGFCFGGRVVLDMARRGVPLKAVASFHGLLETATPAAEGMVKGELLLATGGKDPLVPPEVLETFTAEMDKAKANYHIDTYPDARHGFTNPQATANGIKNQFDALHYDEAAAKTSWQNMLNLLERTL